MKRSQSHLQLACSSSSTLASKRLRNMSPEQAATKCWADNLKGWSSTHTHCTTVDGKTLFNRLVEDKVAKQEKSFFGIRRGQYFKSLKLACGSHVKEFSSSQAASEEVEVFVGRLSLVSCHGFHAAKLKQELAHDLALNRGAVQHA